MGCHIPLAHWLDVHFYCTISINSAITHHRPSGFGWNWLLVPRHKLSGWLKNPKGHFGASHRIQVPHAVAKIWCLSQAHQRLADAKILASQSQVTPLDKLIKIVQYTTFMQQDCSPSKIKVMVCQLSGYPGLKVVVKWLEIVWYWVPTRK